jgi:hydrogenase maturation factor HypF (carbamoyltransferase family)
MIKMYQCPICLKNYKNKATALACPVCHPELQTENKTENKPKIEKPAIKEKSEQEKLIAVAKKKLGLQELSGNLGNEIHDDNDVWQAGKKEDSPMMIMIIFILIIVGMLCIFFKEQIIERIFPNQKKE